MATVDIDDEFLDLFYGITGDTKPSNCDSLTLKRQLIRIADAIKELNENSKKPITSKLYGNENVEDEELTNNAILVVDDLGVITYQLKILLSQFDIDVDCSQEIYDAVNKFKKRQYQYVVMDLFIPTEREGFILMTELKKIISKEKLQTVIGVITASPRKELEQQCRARGVDFFLEKNNDWQNRLLSIMQEYIGTPEEDF